VNKNWIRIVHTINAIALVVLGVSMIVNSALDTMMFRLILGVVVTVIGVAGVAAQVVAHKREKKKDI